MERCLIYSPLATEYIFITDYIVYITDFMSEGNNDKSTRKTVGTFQRNR